MIINQLSLKCPNCSDEMILSDKNGVEIDYCPRCKGVWLDRGELEKLTNMQNRYEEDRYRRYSRGEREYDDDEHGYNRGHRKRGFLGNIFDFD